MKLANTLVYTLEIITRFRRPYSFLELLAQMNIVGCPINWNATVIRNIALSGSRDIDIGRNSRHPIYASCKEECGIISMASGDCILSLDENSVIMTMYSIVHWIHMMNVRNSVFPVPMEKNVANVKYDPRNGVFSASYPITPDQLEGFSHGLRASDGISFMYEPTSSIVTLTVSLYSSCFRYE